MSFLQRLLAFERETGKPSLFSKTLANKPIALEYIHSKTAGVLLDPKNAQFWRDLYLGSGSYEMAKTASKTGTVHKGTVTKNCNLFRALALRMREFDSHVEEENYASDALDWALGGNGMLMDFDDLVRNLLGGDENVLFAEP
jgi:hypothetical protein